MSPLAKRRWKLFFGQKRAWIGLFIFGLLSGLSMTAELWSHQNPIFMYRESKLYLPSVLNYSAQSLGVTDGFIVNYPELLAKDAAAAIQNTAVFPINPWDPYLQTAEVLAAPSRQHWIGTDSLGRDVFARLLYGIRVSLCYALLYWVFSFAIGITIGSIQGYFAGSVDFTTERIKELAEILPFLSVVILVNGLTQAQSFWVTLGVVLIFSWIGISSQLRAQFLSLRKREFCEAARALGGSNARVIFRHILPNALTPILTLTPFTISSGIATLAVLDYLGYGLNPPTPSLGEMLQQGRNTIANAPWLLIAPTLALVLLLISINLIGESLRDAFDPKAS